MNEVSPERTRQALHPAMHEKILVRAAELVELGWTRATAARDADRRRPHTRPCHSLQSILLAGSFQKKTSHHMILHHPEL